MKLFCEFHRRMVSLGYHVHFDQNKRILRLFIILDSRYKVTVIEWPLWCFPLPTDTDTELSRTLGPHGLCGGMPSLRWSTHWTLWWLPLHWAQTAWLVQLRVEWPKPWQLWHCLALDVDDVDDFGVVVVALGRLPGWDSVWLVSWDRLRRLLLLAVFQPSSREASSGVEATGAGRWSSGAGAAGANDLSSSRDVFFAVFLGVLVLVLVLLPRRGWGCVIAGTALPTRGSSSRLSRSSTHRWNSEVKWSRRACRSEAVRRMVVLLIWRSREKCVPRAQSCLGLNNPLIGSSDYVICLAFTKVNPKKFRRFLKLTNHRARKSDCRISLNTPIFREKISLLSHESRFVTT